ncbi:hypothetical protein [Halobacterium sp. BOL4-2]|uniref:hypothetical protein n=1 Tax=Halobacterium sp. BOL4-2 TaxID=2810537 RepID=UPI001E2BCB91|nr:hypothetical protein [Halobacterium sp. BOL4-2]UDF60577.1 hypothetical protein JRZ79_13595 [Halobacterium sp. BOL4-2]
MDKEEVTTENVTTAFQFDGNNEFLTEEYDDAVLLRRGTTIVGQWPSKAALLADVAISKILAVVIPTGKTSIRRLKGKFSMALGYFSIDARFAEVTFSSLKKQWNRAVSRTKL